MKMVATAVVAQRAGDRITGEIESKPVACYSAEELVALWHKAEAEIAEANAAELAAAPNRAERRRKAPAKKRQPKGA